MFPGRFAKLADRPLKELGIGREGDVLRLYRGIDGDAGQIALLQGAGVVGNPQAFVQKNIQAVVDALSPMAPVGAPMRQFVLEKFLAGEVLEIGVVHPALPDLFVG